MRALAVLAPVLVGALALGAPVRTTAVEANDAGAADAGGTPACVLVRGEARYIVAGYKHIVIITNGCSKPVSCAVSTNVNPEVQRVDVKPQTTVEVMTFLESPASTFVPFVRCTT
jgi:hypothetical protein